MAMEGIRNRTRLIIVLLVAALAGVAAFILLYGTQVLSPTYTEWLMDGGGLSKGYLGWRLFQGADWQLPPGAIASLGYPEQVSVAATDSVPLLAVIAKLFSPLFDGPFQYFGWWGLICFLLQGIFGGLISLRVTRSTWQAVCGSLLFLLSPILIQSTFASAGMAGHWVVLAALLPLVYRQVFLSRSKLPIIFWGLLGAVSIGIHGQLALICGIFCIGYCVYAVVTSGQWEKCLPFVVFLLVSLTAGWLFGTFAGGFMDIRFFGISLWGLWDPYSYSRVLRNMSNVGDYQYAGFAFVGFGTLLLCALALIWWIKPYFTREGMGKILLENLRTHRADVAAFAFVFLACILLGLAQLVVYLLMALVLSVLASKMSKKLVSILLAVCLCLQAYDASTIFVARRLHYDRTAARADTTTDMADWNALIQGGTWSTVLISPAVLENIHLAPLVEAIAQEGSLRLNTLSYATDSDHQSWEGALYDPQEDMIFVFTAEELLEEDRFEDVFAQVGYLYQWDDLVVGFVKPTLLPFPQVLGTEDISFLYHYTIGRNSHLRGGEDIGGIRYIYPGGLSYGPYLDLGPGRYELRITGERLDEAQCWFTYQEGMAEPSETITLPSERVYLLDVSEGVTGLEILIENNTSQTLFFDAITVTQLD